MKRTTSRKWITYLKCHYSAKLTGYPWIQILHLQKNYYNDKHKSEANIKYRHEFIKRYFEYELCTHRWVQLPIEEYEKMVANGEVFSGEGYEYTNSNNKPCIEFHVDDNPLFSNDTTLHPFSGNLSIRKLPEKN